MMQLTLSVQPGRFAICRLAPTSKIPDWAMQGAFFALVRTAEELSIVCEETLAPESIQSENGWRTLKVEGPLDFSLTGILADLSGILAKARISIFAISTYDTDYLLVKDTSIKPAITALRESGYAIKD
jgi:hypothetical protein